MRICPSQGSPYGRASAMLASSGLKVEPESRVATDVTGK